MPCGSRSKRGKPKKYLYRRIAPEGNSKGYGWHTLESARKYRKKGWKFIPASQGK